MSSFGTKAVGILLTATLLSLSVHSRTLKIASYNVENLFDARHDGHEYKGYIPGRNGWGPQMLRKKLHNIAQVICDIDADVIALQEIENDHALSQLQSVLESAGCAYRYRAITDTSQSTVRNAVLSRIRLRKRRDVIVRRQGKYRSILEVQLLSDPSITLFVNHWSSKKNPESSRIPYAEAVMRRIQKMPVGSEYLIVGDFNTHYNEFMSISSKHNDTQGRVGLNHLLRTVWQNKIVRLDQLHTNDARLHYSLWMELPTHERWSHNFYGEKQSLDAILIPASLHDGKGWEYYKDSFGVYKPNYLFGKYGRIQRWEYRYGKHRGKGYSDHLPIYATISNTAVTDETKKKSGIWQSIRSLFRQPSETTIQPLLTQPKAHADPSVTIAQLIAADTLEKPLVLRGAYVVFKRGSSATIKQAPEGRAILLYRCAQKLKEGKRYDLVVHKKKRYKGLDEIVDIEISREIDSQNNPALVRPLSDRLMQDSKAINEIVGKLKGVYRDRYLVIGAKQYPIHFRKKVTHPKNGSRLRIKRAQIGYYKDHSELVIWSDKDYKVME